MRVKAVVSNHPVRGLSWAAIGSADDVLSPQVVTKVIKTTSMRPKR
jgi:hypothetical protein